MCHPKKGLHGGKKKATKKSKKKSPKKVDVRRKEEKPCEAQLFFLMNEDVLN